jgi:hypothetical protein
MEEFSGSLVKEEKNIILNPNIVQKQCEKESNTAT